MVHLPLVGLLLAVLFDLVAVQNCSSRWRDAATAMWWIGFLGAAGAITTGLIAYSRVEHSDAGHEEMVLHRNLVFVSVAVLLITALWRWRRPYSRAAAIIGLVGALGLVGAGYLGGDLVYRHGIGIPTEVLEQVVHERGPHAHGHPEEPAHPDTTIGTPTLRRNLSSTGLGRSPDLHDKEPLP
jgi:uncharacterized membrane protein